MGAGRAASSARAREMGARVTRGLRLRDARAVSHTATVGGSCGVAALPTLVVVAAWPDAMLPDAASIHAGRAPAVVGRDRQCSDVLAWGRSARSRRSAPRVRSAGMEQVPARRSTTSLSPYCCAPILARSAESRHRPSDHATAGSVRCDGTARGSIAA
jgi:hypothetical protein